jgi:hypothetical protein
MSKFDPARAWVSPATRRVESRDAVNARIVHQSALG